MIVTVRRRLDPPEVRAVLDLVGAVADHDGVHPVSEHVLLHLRHGGERAAYHLLARPTPAGPVAGYAHLDVTDRVFGPSAELAVHPAFRRVGVATELLARLEQHAETADRDPGPGSPDGQVRADGPVGRLRLWAHGRHPGAAALARGRGYVQQRALWLMRRSLLAPLPDAAPVSDVRIRPFAVGRDEPAWTALNNRAFAEHPEQGGWSLPDIEIREKEPWFDPAGFLLAERTTDGSLVGFHWTKVHRARSAHPHEPVGEVYVVGVDPALRGTGLGRLLTLAGLRHLRGRGLRQVMLYVDETNTGAIALYTRLGFTRSDTDVQYRRAT